MSRPMQDDVGCCCCHAWTHDADAVCGDMQYAEVCSKCDATRIIEERPPRYPAYKDWLLGRIMDCGTVLYAEAITDGAKTHGMSHRLASKYLERLLANGAVYLNGGAVWADAREPLQCGT